MSLNPYAKSVVGALVAGLGSLQVALVDNHVTTVEWITVASATVAALGLVWGVPNGRTEPTLELDDAPSLDVPAGDDTAHADLP